jgi:hypothetical protein
MAEFSRFHTTNNTGDGPSAGYSAANFQQFIRETFITNTAAEGVLYGVGNNLAVTAAAPNVAVNTGAALNYGVYYGNDASVNVNIPTPASATRIDRIVLRYSWSAQTVRITRIAGSEGSGSAPAMTQTANTTWDIPLANVSITTGGVITVTDQRTYVKHPGVYGWLNQANTWTGNQTISGTLIATQHQTDSSNYWTLSGGTNPVFVWDGVNDYTLYNRAGNTLSDVIGGVTVRSVDASGNMTIPGSFSAGGINASQLSSGTVPLARLSGISTSQLAADSVDDTIVGNRVPQFWRRQGGSASDWSSIGTSTQTPTTVRMQAGANQTSGGGTVAVTFPTAFSQPPIIFIQTVDGANVSRLSSITASGFTANTFTVAGGAVSSTFFWLAIGAE